MFKGQTLKDRAGVEVCLFPMETITVTQEYMTGTHKGSYNIDLGGSGIGIDPMFTPATSKVVSLNKDGKGNACVIESLEPTWLADGTYDYFHCRAVHDNDVSDLFVGKVLKQGEKWYDEGTSGQATGNHIHFSVAKGKFKGIELSSAGYYKLIGDVKPETILFINNTVMRKPIYQWKEFTEMLINEPKLPKLTVLATVLQYRKEPKLTSESYGKLPKGGVFTFLGEVIEKDGGYRWAKIDVGDRIAFCAMASLSNEPWVSISEPEYEEPINIDTVIDEVHIIIQKGVVK